MPPAPELSEQRLALVVATTTYADPGLRELRSPASDATAMAEVLADPAIGAFHVTPVVDRPEYEIRRTIDDFLTDRTPDDLILIYLSCHGILDARGRLYFAATDTTKPRLNSTAVESAWLLDRLEECRARRQVLILDCCFSGAFATKADGDIDLERRLIGKGRGRAVLTASRASEYSYEGKPLTGEDPNSVFTAALIEGLRTGQADHDADGYITVEEAFTYAADHIRTQGGTQTPQRWLYGGEEAIILARNPKGAKTIAVPIPDALQLSLDSPYANVRIGAVHTLGEWLASDDPGQVLTAQQTLHKIAAEDSPKVAAVARELIPKAEPKPELKPKPQPFHRQAPVRPSRTRHRTTPPSSEIFSYRPLLTIKAIRGWNSKSVWGLAFSPDGRRLATASEDSTVRLWDTGNGQQIGEPLRGHAGSVYSVAFSPNGRLLASAGADYKIRLWNLDSGQPLDQPVLQGHTDGVNTLAFSPDGHLLASGSADKTVQLWNFGGGQPTSALLLLQGDTEWVGAVAFSPEGHLLAAGGGDNTVRLWNPHTGRIFRTLEGHTDGIHSVAFSPDGSLLASAGEDKLVRLWHLGTDEPDGDPLTGHTAWVGAVAFNPDGVLASGGGDNTIRLWDPVTGQLIGTPLAGHTAGVPYLAFSPDGRLLASAGHDKTVRLWERVSRAGVERPPGRGRR